MCSGMLAVKSGAHSYDQRVHDVAPSRARLARERARAEVLAEIVAAGDRQLGEVGAAQLSVRAIARELGMPSSGIYRYVSTRDELLTLLITAAYDDLASRVEAAAEAPGEGDPAGRFRAACAAVRSWALAHPHRYALIFGSPVPGYRAPESTTRAATRVPAVLAAILASHLAGREGRSTRWRPRFRTAGAEEALAPAVAFFGGGPVEAVQRGLMVWSAIFGAVSWELFGHLDGSVEDDPAARAAWFAECVERWAAELGLVRPGAG